MLSTSTSFLSAILFERAMNQNITVEKPKTFSHGDLLNALLTAGLEMARVGDPDAAILREAGRPASVSQMQLKGTSPAMPRYSMRCDQLLSLA
jgi:hypothetical protein